MVLSKNEILHYFMEGKLAGLKEEVKAKRFAEYEAIQNAGHKIYDENAFAAYEKRATILRNAQQKR